VPLSRRTPPLLAALAGLAGCGVDRDPPPVPDTDPTARWGARLSEVVSAEGEVDYTALRADHAALDDYVGWVAAHGPESDGFRLQDDDRRLAWHINAANALTLWAVVEGLRPDDVTDGPPLARLRFLIDREPRMLSQHRRDTILAVYEEPLAAAALGCAARSCPPMPAHLFERKELDEQLERQMRRWVDSGRLVTEEGGEFVFSPVLDGVREDFRRWDGVSGPCAIVAPYAPPDLRERMEAGCPYRWAPWDGALDGR
jgi:hypothetical protein